MKFIDFLTKFIEFFIVPEKNLLVALKEWVPCGRTNFYIFLETKEKTYVR